jgi:Outer membrane receptor for ferrienterochelin and colicins
MKRLLCAFAAVVISAVALYAQEVPAAPAADEAAPAKDTAKWKKGLITQVGFSQLSLTNWSAGGSGSISLNTYFDAYGNMEKGKLFWDNEAQLGYGFIRSFDDAYPKKSDDRIILDSKIGYKATQAWYYSAVFNFRSQMAKGYDYKKSWTEPISQFFAPAYFSLGIGIDYKPSKNFSLNIAPITGKTVFVSNPELRKSYGNYRINEDGTEDLLFCKFELGAQIKADAKVEVENFKLGTSLTLFSDYLDKPQNIKVNWDVNVDAKISKFFSVTLRTNLIYDDNIKCKDAVDKETGAPIKVAGVQFKELFSVGFSYTFGEKK